MRMFALWLVLFAGCASQERLVLYPDDTPPRTTGQIMRLEFNAQVRCLSGQTIEIWQCPDDASCRVVRYECPNQ